MKHMRRISPLHPVTICLFILTVVPPKHAMAQTLTVNAKSVVQTLTGTAFGVNMFYWADNHASLPYFKEAGFKSVRYPGGGDADAFVWTNNKVTNPWPLFVSDMKSAGVKGKDIIITCNYGRAGTAAMAADWVRDANITRKLGIKYWELGNEEWDNADPVKYASDYVKWSAAMKAVDPSIKLGAVGTNMWGKHPNEAVINPVTHQREFTWSPIMLNAFRTLRVTPDFIIEHQYQFGPGTENDAKLLTGLDTNGWSQEFIAKDQVRAKINNYLPNASRVPIMQTESGSVWSNPGKQSVNLPGGLAMAIILGDSIQTEYRATDWWLWEDNYTNTDPAKFNMSPSLYGWRNYGHYGLATFDKLDRHPVFYVAKMLNKFVADGDKVLACTSSEPLLKIYSTKHGDGTMSVLVINTAPSTDYNNIPINLTGYKARGNATVWTYGKANDDAAKNQQPGQDLTQTTQAVSGSTIIHSYPQYSATLMTFSSGSNRRH